MAEEDFSGLIVPTSTPALQSAQRASIDIPQADASRLLSLQIRTGMPSEFIQQDPNSVEKDASREDFDADSYRTNNPRFSKWLTENPHHYAFAAKDLGFYEKIGQMDDAARSGWKSVPRAERRAEIRLKQMDRVLAGDSFDLQSDEIDRLKEMDESDQLDAAMAESESAPAYVARASAYTTRQFGSSVSEGAKGFAGGAAVGAALGAAGGPTALPAGLSAGGVGALAMSARYTYNLEAGLAFDKMLSIKDVNGKAIDKKSIAQVSKAVGAVNAMIEVGSDVAIAAIVGFLAPAAPVGVPAVAVGKQALKNTVMAATKKALGMPVLRDKILKILGTSVKTAGVEMGEEGLQGFVSALGEAQAEKISGQDFTPKSMSERMAGTDKELLQVFVGQMTGPSLLFGGIGAHNAMRQVRKAEQTKLIYDAMSKGVKDSTAFNSLPAKAAEGLKSIISEGPMATTYFQAVDWKERFEAVGVDPVAAAAAVMGDEGKAYTDALAAGDKNLFSMPTEAYASQVAPQHGDFFNERIRPSPNDLSFLEAEEENKRSTEEATSPEAKTAQNQAAEAELVEKEIAAELKQKYKDSGRTDLEAGTLAKEQAHALVLRAELRGVSPRALQATAGEGFSVRGPEQGSEGDGQAVGETPQAAGSSFQQQAVLGPVQVSPLQSRVTEHPQFVKAVEEAKPFLGTIDPRDRVAVVNEYIRTSNLIHDIKNKLFVLVLKRDMGKEINESAAGENVDELGDQLPDLADKLLGLMRLARISNQPDDAIKWYEADDSGATPGFYLQNITEERSFAQGPVKTQSEVSAESLSGTRSGITWVTSPNGTVLVTGDIEKAKKDILLHGVKAVGTKTKAGLSFGSSVGHRVAAILSGDLDKVKGSRAGLIFDHETYAGGDQAGQIKGAPKKYNTEKKLPKMRAVLKGVAEDGVSGRFWYENAGKFILKMTGGDLEMATKFAAITAIYSQGTGIGPNMTNALKAWYLYLSGKPIHIPNAQGTQAGRFQSQDREAHEILYNDKKFDGEKRSNFFINLMRNIDPEKYSNAQGVTDDLWMMRLFGYEAESPSPLAYKFVEVETNRLAKELGWEPQQVQAALWVAIRSMGDQKSVKEKTDSASLKAKDFKWGPKGTRIFSSVDAETRHRMRWIENALAARMSPEEIAQQKSEYEDFTDNYRTQVSVESTPGPSSGILPELQKAPMAIRHEYHEAIFSEFRDAEGNSILANIFNLPWLGEYFGLGFWEGATSPGTQFELAVPPRHKPSKKGPQAGGPDERITVSEDSRRALNAFTATIAYLLGQDAGAWHRPFQAPSLALANMVDIKIGEGRPALDSDMTSVYTVIEKEAPGLGIKPQDVVLIPSKDGLHALNVSGVDNKIFHSLIKKAVHALGDVDVTMNAVSADSNVMFQDWREDPSGKNYQLQAVDAGFGDAFAKAVSLLAPRLSAVRKDFASRYRWTNPDGPTPASSTGQFSEGIEPGAPTLKYTPNKSLSPPEVEMETKMARILSDKKKSREDYSKLIRDGRNVTLGGKIRDIDLARFLLPEIAESKDGMTAWASASHEPISAWLKEWQEEDRATTRKENKTREKRHRVTIIAGPAGAGKSTSRDKFLSEYIPDSTFILDGAMSGREKVLKLVQDILDDGTNIAYAYVHNSLERIQENNISRFPLEGRIPPADSVLEYAANSEATFLMLVDAIKTGKIKQGNGRGVIKIVISDNSTGVMAPKQITIDKLHELSYTNSADTPTPEKFIEKHREDNRRRFKYVEEQKDEIQRREFEKAVRRGRGEEDGGVRQQGGQGSPGRPEGGQQGDRGGPEGRVGDRNPKILEQAMRAGGEPGGESRGRSTFSNWGMILDFFSNSDGSTGLHELGHGHLEAMRRDFAFVSLIPEADRTPSQVKFLARVQTILDWFGVKSFDEIERKHHEMFARGWEKYHATGEAPSAKMRDVFVHFKTWLIAVYRDVKNLGVEISPEVKSVFDRIVASEDEIASAEAEMGRSPLFSDPSGMTAENFAKYQEALIEVRTSAKEALLTKLMADLSRKDASWWKEQYAATKEEVAALVNQLPAYKALYALQKGTFPDGSEYPEGTLPPKISKEEVVKKYGVDKLKGLPRGIFSDDGAHPDVVASINGYKDGSELLSAIEGLEDKDALIEKMTEERMKEQYGDLLSDGRIHDEAVEAIHTDKRSQLLRMELDHLISQNFSDFKGLARKIARRVPTVAAVREWAVAMIGGTASKDIRPIIYSQAEGRYANEAVDLLLNGDLDGAILAKEKELRNHELYRAAVAARDTLRRLEGNVKKLFRPDEDLAKTRDMDLIGMARAIVARVGFGKSAKSVEQYLTQVERLDPELYDSIRSLSEGLSPDAANYKDMKFDDLVAISQAVSALWDLSKRNKQVMIDGKLMATEDAVSQLTAQLGTISTPKESDKYTRSSTKWDKAVMRLLGIRASLRRVETWVDAIDMGNPSGPFRTMIWNPISEATANFRAEKKSVLKKYLEIVKSIESSLSPSDINSDELGHIFTGKAELLHAMLHTGNDSNLSKLLRGYGWGDFDETGELDTSKWDSFVSRMQKEGVLTKADYDYLQATWDLLESLKDPAQIAHKEMFGFYFGEIKSRPINTPWGAYRGGYVPAIVDPMLASDAAIREEREMLEKSNNSYMFPTAGKGFTNKRVEGYARPLALDLRYIPLHIDKVLRFIHIEPRVKDVSRILFNRSFRSRLESFDPTVAGDMLVPWLQRSAQQMIEGRSSGWAGKALDGLSRELRRRTGMQIMVGNVSNTMQQFTGLSIAALKVSPRFLRDALFRYIKSPDATAKLIAEKSKFMETTLTGGVFDIQAQIDDLLLNPSKYEEARAFAMKHGYFMQAFTQNIVSNIVWIGSYEQAINSGADEKSAVRQADSAVRETQGSFNPEDISRFETGTPFVRNFTMFYSYFNMQANILGTEFQKVAQGVGLKNGAGKLFYAYFFGFMIPAFISELITKSFAGKLDDDDDGDYMDDFIAMFFGSQLRTATAMFPVVGPVAQAGINSFNNKWYDDRVTTSPAVSMIESAVKSPATVYDAMTGKKPASKGIKDGLTLLGLVSGFPLAPLGRPAGYLADVAQGEAHPTGPIDFTRGLVTGKK